VSARELGSALGPVLQVLRELGVRHYVGGSIASSFHGVARASVDADVVADLLKEHAERLVGSLQRAYYVPETRVRDAVARRSSFNLIHLETMLKVDVFVSKARAFDRRALDRSRVETVDAAGGLSLPLASAEDTVLAKLEWYRRGGEVSERQWSDVLGVLRVSQAALDRDYLLAGARELAVDDLLDHALKEAEA